MFYVAVSVKAFYNLLGHCLRHSQGKNDELIKLLNPGIIHISQCWSNLEFLGSHILLVYPLYTKDGKYVQVLNFQVIFISQKHIRNIMLMTSGNYQGYRFFI